MNQNALRNCGTGQTQRHRQQPIQYCHHGQGPARGPIHTLDRQQNHGQPHSRVHGQSRSHSHARA